MRKIISLLLCLLTVSIASAQELKWRALPSISIVTARFEDICFINANTGWTITSYTADDAHNNYTLKTTNGGESWTKFTDTNYSYYRCISFADSLHGWIGMLGIGYPQIIKTTNGGMNWSTSLFTPNSDSNNVCGIQAMDRNLVYACGRWNGPARFYKTTNGGVNWTVKSMAPLATTLIDCYFYSRDSGFVVGGLIPSPGIMKAVVLFTADGGNTWVSKYTSTALGWGWKINFPTKNVGYISVESNNTTPSIFLKTTNGGASWQEKTLLATAYDEEGIGFANENSGWVGGWFGNSYKTTNGGDNWVLADEFSPGGANASNLNRFRFINDSLGYAAGKTIYKYSRDSVVSIQQISDAVPTDFSLKQNFPNPFNPGTKIRFDVVSKTAEIQIIVYNSLGQPVETLIKGKLTAGTYEVEFSADKHPSGVYYYTLVANNYSITKKMMLIK